MIHTMLPVQYLRQADARLMEPQKRLMLAVLQAVVDDCQAGPGRREAGHATPNGRAFQDASAYLQSTDRTWPFSFENLCEAIGLDADALRRELTEPARRSEERKQA
jgi:hypothetical protein